MEIVYKRVAAILELTHYRKKLTEARASELQRLAKVLEDGRVKIGSVDSELTTPSASEVSVHSGGVLNYGGPPSAGAWPVAQDDKATRAGAGRRVTRGRAAGRRCGWRAMCQ